MLVVGMICTIAATVKAFDRHQLPGFFCLALQTSLGCSTFDNKGKGRYVP